MRKILFVAAHRLNRSPSQRFRFEQYFEFLEKNGFECSLSPLLDEKDDLIFYSRNNFLGKAGVLLRSFRRRWNDLKQASDYDIIFIQREAFMTGTTFFEKRFKRLKKKIVFDFDDAIWLPNISEGNRNFSWLKDPSKTSEILTMADAIIAGNNYLKNYAINHNANVHCIPTTIDTDYHKIKNVEKPNKICIGWTGSPTTIQYFNYAVPILVELKKKYGSKIYFKVIGDETYRNEDLDIQGEKWTTTDEIEQLCKIDTGIMTLPDNEWSKGKCGLKGLQYMALEIPCIMSPVGVNSDIIQDGVNGFLADNRAEWITKLSALIEDAELRKKIGINARKTVEEKYSVNAQKQRYLELFQSLISI